MVLSFAQAQISAQTNTATPDNHNALMRAASEHMKNKNYDGAIVELNKILQTKPNNLNALYHRAVSNYHLNRFEQSLADLDKIIAGNVQFEYYSGRSYGLRAEIHFKQKNRAAAISDAATAIKLTPEETLGYSVLKAILTPEQYAAELSKLIALKEKQGAGLYPLPYSERALFYITRNQSDLAAPDAVKALMFDQKNALGGPTRGTLWIFLDEYYRDKPDLYVPELTKIINSPLSEPLDALTRRARVYFQQKKFDLTIADMTKAVSLLNAAQLQDLEGAGFHSLRARAYAEIGKPDLALADLKKVFATKYYQAVDYDLRARIYCQTGRKAEAKADEKMVAEFGGTVANPCK